MNSLHRECGAETDLDTLGVWDTRCRCAHHRLAQLLYMALVGGGMKFQRGRFSIVLVDNKDWLEEVVVDAYLPGIGILKECP